jgi:hypothetical protein
VARTAIGLPLYHGAGRRPVGAAGDGVAKLPADSILDELGPAFQMPGPRLPTESGLVEAGEVEAAPLHHHGLHPGFSYRNSTKKTRRPGPCLAILRSSTSPVKPERRASAGVTSASPAADSVPQGSDELHRARLAFFLAFG